MWGQAECEGRAGTDYVVGSRRIEISHTCTRTTMRSIMITKRPFPPAHELAASPRFIVIDKFILLA